MISIPALNFGSGADVVALGDVQTGGLATICAEGWFRVAAISQANRPLLMKYGATGHEWALYVTRDGRVYFTVFVAGGVNVACTVSGAIHRQPWTHVAGCYDGSHCQVFIGGADATATSRVRGGATLTSTGQAAQIGGYIGQVSVGFIGRAGWCRLSDACRYPAAVLMPDQYPTADGNTLGLWYADEQAGSVTVNQAGSAAYDGVISGATWTMSVVRDKRLAGAAVTGRLAGRSMAGAAVTGQLAGGA